MSNSDHPTFGHGKICYLEIPARDTREAAVFYKEVFGWHIRSDQQGNTTFDDGVGEVSGMWVTGRAAATDPLLVVHIMVDDIYKTIDAIYAQGGSIVQEVGTDSPELTARFSDPTGNMFGLYQHGGKK